VEQVEEIPLEKKRGAASGDPANRHGHPRTGSSLRDFVVDQIQDLARRPGATKKGSVKRATS